MKTKLTQLSAHTWLFPHDPNPRAVQSSVGVIATSNQALLVDAGNSPGLARKIKAELAMCHLPSISRIVYTHHHWDHVYGACEFDVPVTAHNLCRELLEVEASKPWSIQYINEQIRYNPKLKLSYRARARVIDDWSSFRIVLPEDLFSKDAVIDLDGLTIELEHVGGDHAADSIVIRVVEDGVMFIGDCYYPPPLHLRRPDSVPSLEMLRSLKDDAYQLYVEGHDKPFTHAELLRQLQKNK